MTGGKKGLARLRLLRFPHHVHRRGDDGGGASGRKIPSPYYMRPTKKMEDRSSSTKKVLPVVLAEIPRPQRDNLVESTPAAKISHVQHLSSYNWIDRKEPTIVVPGRPALWAPPKETHTQVREDGAGGTISYVDQNAARLPNSPVEPLFRALFITRPEFDISNVDLVTDRNNLRKLLSFVNPRLGGKSFRRREFSIVAEAVDGCRTVIFRRVEPASFFEPTPGSSVGGIQGYGHAFEKAYTTDRVKGSTAHHRIISYRFAGLNMVVRYETDGCVAPSNNTMGDPSEESILEIKTRKLPKRIGFQDVMPQLWMSQTHKLVRASHVDGLFERPDVENVADHCEIWEVDHQEDLRKLAHLIKDIIAAVLRIPTGQAVIKYDDRVADKLMVLEDDAETRLLPNDIYDVFERSVKKRQTIKKQRGDSYA